MAIWFTTVKVSSTAHFDYRYINVLFHNFEELISQNRKSNRWMIILLLAFWQISLIGLLKSLDISGSYQLFDL